MKSSIFLKVVAGFLLALWLFSCSEPTVQRTFANGQGTIIQIDTIKGNLDSLEVCMGYQFEGRFLATKQTLPIGSDIAMYEDHALKIDQHAPSYWELGELKDDGMLAADSMILCGRIYGADGQAVRGRIRNKEGQRTTLFKDGVVYFVINNLIDNQIVLDRVGQKAKYINVHKDTIGSSSLVILSANFDLPMDTAKADLIFDWEEDSWLFLVQE